MDSKVVKLLKINEKETGKDLLSNLTEDHLKKLEFYYENLSEDEQQDIDQKIISGEDNDFIDVSLGLAGYYDEVKYDQGMKDFTENVIGNEEGGNSTATALETEQKVNDDQMGQEIDPKNLELLGIKDTVDITVDDYKTLLREKITEARLRDTGMSTEDIESLTDEFKKIKNETGTFKTKKKKIGADAFKRKAEVVKEKDNKPTQINPQKLLPPSILQEPKDEQVPDGLDDLLNDIRSDQEKTNDILTSVLAPSFAKMEENLKNILGNTKKINEAKKEESRDADIGEQKEERKGREAELEDKAKKGGGFKKIAAKIKPVGGFFDMLMNFLKNILLGGAIVGLMNILENPVGFFINPVIKTINENLVTPLNGVLKDIFTFLSDPIQGVIDGLNTAGGFVIDRINDALALFNFDPIQGFDPIPDFEIPQIPEIKLIEPPKEESGTNSKPKVPSVKGMKGGGEVKSSKKKDTPVKGMKDGGEVKSSKKKDTPVKGMKGGGEVKSSKKDTSVNLLRYNKGGEIYNYSPIVMNGTPMTSYSGGGSIVNGGDSVVNLYSGGGSIVNGGDSVINSYSGGGSVVNNNSNTSNTSSLISSFSNGGSVVNNNSNTSNNSDNSNISSLISSFSNGGPVFNNLYNKSNTESSTKPQNINNFRFDSGGPISSNSGQTISGMGPDTQLIAAQPGEIVMSKSSVNYWGKNNLLSMNKEGGGTNIPKTGKVAGFSSGGVVQPVPQGSYKGQSGQKYGDSRKYGGHNGIDITEDSPYGQDPKIPVVSMADGKVVGDSPNYPYLTSGYTSNLSVNHGNGLIATYLHMKPSLKVGSPVRKGQKVGKLIPLGSKENNYAQTHLHLETHKDGKKINPLKVLGGTVKPGTGSEIESLPNEGAPAMKSVAQVLPKSKESTSQAPSPPSSANLKTIFIPPAGEQKSGSKTNSSSAAQQKNISAFSAIDSSNTELMVVKSIYNVIG